MEIESFALAVMAASLIALSTANFVTAGIARCRTTARVHRRRAMDLKGLRQAAEIARLNSELQSKAVASSIQWRVMEVAEIVDESEDCRSFYLIDPYRQPLPDFRPGQHLLVRPALAGAYQTTRCYSISSSPDRRYWRITVKRQSSAQRNSQRSTQGELSVWLHETIHAGDCLLIGGPNGQFYLPADSNGPLVLVAAGIGITPLASMLRWSLEHTPLRPITLFFQAKDPGHWPLGARLHRWQRDFPNCRIQSFFSQVGDNKAKTSGGDLPDDCVVGKFTAQHVLQSDPRQECDYFLCGPQEWMESIRRGLVEGGVPPDRVHWESFGTNVGSISIGGEEESITGLPVRFEHSSVDAQWHDPEQSLWSLAREHGIEIASGCLSGVCGSCRVRLLAGEVEYDRDISIDLAANECLPCVARPKTSVTIDV